MSKLYVDVWKKALENVSGKTLPTKNYTELAELISDFNDLYRAKVTFTKTPANTTIVLKNAKGEIIGAESDGTYILDVGTYSYDATAEGYTSKINQSLTIASSDVTSGKTVTVTLTAIGE